MRVSASAYYAWCKKPPVSGADDTEERVRLRALFAASRQSAGSRTLVRGLCEEGIKISRYRVMKLMKEEGLECQQRRAYRVTTKPRSGAEVAPNLLNQNFNPPGPNLAWTSDITYLRTGEGWMYLATIMALYSRRIVGWHVDKRMTSALVCRALIDEGLQPAYPTKGTGGTYGQRFSIYRETLPVPVGQLRNEKQHGRCWSLLG